MNTELYLRNYQPYIYKTLSHALSSRALSHAYLLSGEAGIPLLPVAKFFAKSIICDNPSPFACEKCWTCLRVDEGNYQDLIILDGANKSVKKEDVSRIVNSFSYTAKESKGALIYVVHLVENMTVEAINALLRFLEEPVDNVYAILTTENEERVLPTIISRTQVLRFKLIEGRKVIEDAMHEGISEEDAQLLSYFYNDANEINAFKETDRYDLLKSLFKQYLKEMIRGRGEAVYFAQTSLTTNIKNKEDVRFFLDLMIEFFHNLNEAKFSNSYVLSSFKSIIDALNDKLDHISESLLLLFELRKNVELNVNVPLLFDKMTYEITKGMKKV